MANFKYILLATMVLAAIPSVLATCGQTLSPSEGDEIELAITPDGSYDYLWSSTYGKGIGDLEGIDATIPEWQQRTISFIAPPQTCPGGVSFTITGQLTSNVDNTPYASCTDSCSITISPTCIDCPTKEEQGIICEKDWADKMSDIGTGDKIAGTDESATDWQLTVPGGATGWASTNKFTWTIHETTTTGTPVATDVTYGPSGETSSHTFVFGDFAQPTNDKPKRCYDVGVLVETAAGEDLLTCNAIGSICLVYDPTRYNSDAGISIDVVP